MPNIFRSIIFLSLGSLFSFLFQISL
jgi:hypothetical protein